MNQYQNRSSEEQKTFLSKIKDNYSSKFGNLSLTSSIQRASNYVDKDGNSPTDTLIHNAFVKYFDSKGEPYPEWLGVPNTKPRAGGSNGYQAYGNGTNNSTGSSQYQPVYTSYNSPRPQGQQQYQPQQPQQPQPQMSMNDERPQISPAQGASYKPRSSSRLQDMYNKSRQQHTPGGGYNTVNQGPNRSNSSTSGSRLRERMLNSSGSMTGLNNVVNDRGTGGPGGNGGSGSSKATWGKR